jgi:hypothetical protein
LRILGLETPPAANRGRGSLTTLGRVMRPVNRRCASVVNGVSAGLIFSPVNLRYGGNTLTLFVCEGGAERSERRWRTSRHVTQRSPVRRSRPAPVRRVLARRAQPPPKKHASPPRFANAPAPITGPSLHPPAPDDSAARARLNPVGAHVRHHLQMPLIFPTQRSPAIGSPIERSLLL